MRWRGRRGSTNVEDRRGRSPLGGRGVPIGCGGILVVIVIALLTGQDPQKLLEMVGDSQVMVDPGASVSTGGGAASDELGQFASVVLRDTEDTWNMLMPRLGVSYREPTLVLFSNAIRSACGFSSAATGPFYCPADGKLYIDLAFFAEMDRRMGAPGDFAQAYVIAHEVGHHVQNLLGISSQVRRMQQQTSRTRANALSVQLELQADCLAGVWGHHANGRRLLEPGDVEEGLNAAAAIGDDRLQRQATGRTSPESWTHGSSEQRVTWLRRGLSSGDPDTCDTFG